MSAIIIPVPADLSRVLNAEERGELHRFLEPFETLRENPFFESKVNLNNKAKAEELYKQATSNEFNRTIVAMERVTVEYSAFTRLLVHLKEKKSIANNPVLLAEIAALENAAIQPVQRFMRFAMLGKEINTHYSKAIAKVPEPESATTQKTFSDLLAHFEKYASKINAERASSEKMEVVKPFLQYQSTQPAKPILDTLAKKVGDADLDKSAEIISKAYVDAYLDGRTASSTGTVKSPDLKMLDEFLTKAIDKHFDASAEKPEKLILGVFANIPTVKDALVSHLFNRAMLEGIVDGKQNQIIYTNAVKAIVRMGDGAVNDWNALVTSKLGSDAPRIENSKLDKNKEIVLMKESAINSTYETFSKLPDIKTRITAAVYPAQLAVLNDYVKAFAETGAREKFLELYLDTYINERVKVGSHTEKGPLLTQLDEAFTKLYKENKKAFGGSAKSTPDSILFNSVNQGPALAARLTERALQRAIASIDSKDPKAFVNCLKAVARMDTAAQWDKLIETKYPQHAILKVANNPIMDKKMSETSIEKLYANVSQPGRGPSASTTGKRSRPGLFDKLSVSIAGARQSASPSDDKSPTSPTSPSPKRSK
jgi:hypothetical protein